VGTNRITEFANTVVWSTQIAFMPGRHILEGMVVLHELYKNKLDGVPLKLDLEKAHDKVKWDFLQQALRMEGI
jgi:hypothetical protein